MSVSIDWRSSDYFAARRVQVEREALAGWPDTDPPPLVTNRDPRPADAPADPRAVVDLAARGRAAGWPVLVGFSRGYKRAQKVGTFTEVESFGVWAGVHPDTGWRWSAMYERKTPQGGLGSETSAGTWTWTRVTIWRDANHFTDASVTDLKDFITVRGSVLPGWFEAIRARESAKTAKAKTAAKSRPRKAKEATS